MLTHPSLEEIDLSNNMLIADAGKNLLNLTHRNPRIQHVGLGGTGVAAAVIAAIECQLQLNQGLLSPRKDGGLPPLSPMLECSSETLQLSPRNNLNVGIQYLDLSGRVGPTGLTAVLPLLQCARNLCHLNLGGNNLGDRSIGKLIGLLQDHPNIEELDLSNNPITSKAGQQLLELAASNRRLVQINVTGTAVRSSVIKQIKAQLQSNLQGKKRGDKGRPPAREPLNLYRIPADQTWPTLVQTVNRMDSGNLFARVPPANSCGQLPTSHEKRGLLKGRGRGGDRKSAEGVGEGPAPGLQELDYSGALGPGGLDKIVPILEHARGLRSLRLRGNGLGDVCVGTLVAALKQHVKLTELDLSGNPITSEAGKQLLKLLQSNMRIAHLEIEGTAIRKFVAKQIHAQLQWNRRLCDALGLPVPPAPAPAPAPAQTFQTEAWAEPAPAPLTPLREGAGDAAPEAGDAAPVDESSPLSLTSGDSPPMDESSPLSLTSVESPVQFPDLQFTDLCDFLFPENPCDLPSENSLGFPQQSSFFTQESSVGGDLSLGLSQTSGIPLEMSLSLQTRRTSFSAPQLSVSCLVEPATTELLEPSREESAGIPGDLWIALQNSSLFSHLLPWEIEELAQAFVLREYGLNSMIHTEGDYHGTQSEMYVVKDGVCELRTRNGTETVAQQIQRGDLVGGEAVFHNAAPSHSIQATTPKVQVWALSQHAYQKVMCKLAIRKRAMYKKYLRKMCFLQPLSEGQFTQLADALQPGICRAGEYLIRHGEEGKWLFLIVDGVVDVYGRGAGNARVKVCEFSKGQCVGELEFINNHPCVADVVARTDVHVAKLKRRHFELCMGPIKELITRRTAVDADFVYYNEWQKREQAAKKKSRLPHIIPKPEEDRQVLVQMFAADTQLFMGNALRHAQAADSMCKRYWKLGETMVEEGQPMTDDDLFFVIWDGECSVVIDGEEICTCGTGAILGEMEMMDDVALNATIKVESERLCAYVLERRTYSQIMSGAMDHKKWQNEVFLAQHPILNQLQQVQMLKLAHAMQVGQAAAGEYLLEAGKDVAWMYVIMNGAVDVINPCGLNAPFGDALSVSAKRPSTDTSGPTNVCELNKGDFCGALELAFDHPKTRFHVQAKTSVKFMKLSKQHFDALLEPIIEVLKDHLAQGDMYTVFGRYRSINHKDENGLFEYMFGDTETLTQTVSFNALDEDEHLLRSRRARHRRMAIFVEMKDFADGASISELHEELTSEVEQALRQVLVKNLLFKHVDHQEMGLLLSAMYPCRFSPSEVILSPNRAHGAISENQYAMHVMIEGSCSILQGRRYQRSLRGLHVLGEENMMENQHSGVTARADTEVRTWALNCSRYHQLMSHIYMQKRARYRDMLKSVYFLQPLSEGEFTQLADALQPGICRAGEYLIRHGEEGKWFFLIVDGVVDVYGRGAGNARIKVCEFSKGQCVGELEFINNHPCVADVVARTDVHVAKLHRKHFELCMGPIKELIAERPESDPDFVYSKALRNPKRKKRYWQICPKPEEDRQLLVEMFAADTQFLSANVRRHVQAADSMFKKYYKYGDIVVEEGQPMTDEDLFMVIWDGECSVFERGEQIYNCGMGTLLGEMEMMYDHAMTVTIRVESERLCVYALERKTYARIMSGALDHKKRLNELFLGQHPILSKLSDPQMLKLAHAFQLGRAAPGEYLLEAGKEVAWTFLIMNGTVEATHPDSYRHEPACELKKGDFVGGIECAFECRTNLLNYRAKLAVTYMKLSKHHFDTCMEPVIDDLKDDFVEGSLYVVYGRRSSLEANEANKLWEYTFGARDETYTTVSFNALDEDEHLLRSRRARHRRMAIFVEMKDFADGASISELHEGLTSEVEQTLRQVLVKNLLFKHVDHQEMGLLLSAMYPCRFSPSEVILSPNRAHGAISENQYAMHVMIEGSCSILQGRRYQRSLRGLHVLGEENMMENQHSGVTARADTEVRTWALNCSRYHQLMSHIYMQKRARYRDMLKSVYFLQPLSEGEFTQLADALQPGICRAGEYLIRHGEEGKWLFLIVDGVVDVYGRGAGNARIKVCEFSKGQCVGELEFINNHPCVADVVARTDVHVAKLHRKHFELCMGPIKELIAERPESDPDFVYYNAVVKRSQAGKKKSRLPHIIPKPEEDRQLLVEMFAADTQLFMGNALRHAQAADSMCKRYWKLGETMVEEGQPMTDDDLFFVIWDGECSVVIDGEEICTCGTGAILGEMEMMDDVALNATIKVESERLCAYVLERRTYSQIMSGAMDHKKWQNEVFLAQHPILNQLQQVQMLKLAHAMQVGQAAAGEYLLEAGKDVAWMYVIMGGAVDVTCVDETGSSTAICELKKGDLVGAVELAFGYAASTCSSVAKTAVKFMKLSKQHFDACLEPIMDELKEYLAQGKVYSLFGDANSPWKVWSALVEYSFGSADLEVDAPSSDCVTLLADVHDVLIRSRRARRRRLAIYVENDCDDCCARPLHADLTADTANAMSQILASHILFRHLNQEEMGLLLSAMYPCRFSPGEVILSAQEEGVVSESSDAMHVMIEGSCSTLQGGRYQRSLRGVQVLGAENMMSMSNQLSVWTARADTEVRTWALNCSRYHQLMSHIYMQKRARYRDMLKSVHFLQPLSEGEFTQLADALQPGICRAGEYLIRHGEEGKWFFLIVDGVVDVYGRGAGNARIKVCEFSKGQCVGELEFINNHPCVADVVARTDVHVAKLHRKHFELCMGPIKELIAKRPESDPDFVYYNELQKKEQTGKTKAPVPHIIPKPEEDRALLVEMFAVDTQMFGNAWRNAQAADRMFKVFYRCGEYIQRAGQPMTDDDLFMVVWSGECSVFIDGDDGAAVHRCEAGALFGEFELVHGCGTDVTVQVESDLLVVYALTRRTYGQIICGAFDRKRRTGQGFLSRHPVLQALGNDERRRLAHAMQIGTVTAGEYLVHEGQCCRWMQVLVHGTVEVTRAGDGGAARKVCELAPGDFVGGIEFAFGHARHLFTVRALTSVKSLILNIIHFDACLGPILPEFRRALAETAAYGAVAAQLQAWTDEGPGKPLSCRSERGLDLSFDSAAPLLCELMHHHILPFRDLDADELQQLVDQMQECRFRCGAVILQEGLRAPQGGEGLWHQAALHVMLQGNCSVFQGDAYMETIWGQRVFGEETVLLHEPSLFTIRADVDVVTWALHCDQYHATMAAILQRKRDQYCGFLPTVALLAELAPGEVALLADALQPHRCGAGEALIGHGEEVLWMYFILEGTVEVTGRTDAGEPVRVGDLGPGQCAGDLEFLHEHVAVADVVARTSVRAAKLHHGYFVKCLGPHREAMARARSRDPGYAYYFGLQRDALRPAPSGQG